jgi:hypothetical protein
MIEGTVPAAEGGAVTAPGGAESHAAPDFIEPVIGWRYWRLDRDRTRLASLTGRAEVWPVGRAFNAVCRHARRDHDDVRYRIVGGYKRSRHGAPEEGCTCGVYAARDLKTLRSKMLFGLGLMVVGEVSMWGKIIAGTRGYRAEYAYPKRLYVVQRTVDWDQSGTVNALSVYGVPVDPIVYRNVTTSPAHVLAVAIATIGENLAAMGEAIAGWMTRSSHASTFPSERTRHARRMQ